MKACRNIIKTVMAAFIILSTMSGCSSTKTEETETTSEINAQYTSVIEEGLFTERDLTQTYDASNAISISLTDKSTSDNNAVSIDDNVFTIKQEGVYIVSGSIENGQIIVDTDKESKVQIVLDNVEITNKTLPAIYVKQADKVFITTEKDSTNTLSTTETIKQSDDEDVDAVIYAKDDLTMNGLGSLSIESNDNGIVSKNDLKVTGNTLTVNAACHALSGKDSVRIYDGSISLTSTKDAIRSQNSDETDKGNIDIVGGDLTINAEGDGIAASGYIKITDGNFEITTGGGSDNAEEKSEQMFGGPGGRQFAQEESSNTETSTTSCKAIKSSGDLTISGGTFTIDSADDAIHSNTDVSIEKGTFTISTGDDGIHADETTTIEDGTITIKESYEGIEGNKITINGGKINVTSSDDGLNAAGGNDGSGMNGMMQPDNFGGPQDQNMEQTETQSDASEDVATITINGGKITINTEGDGVDSNGTIDVNGGTTIVYGPTSNGNGALDYESDATIKGGSFIAIGSSGMAMNFGSSSTQGSIMINASVQEGDTITLKDESGNEILSIEAKKDADNIVISSPKIEDGKSYTITYGNESVDIKMDGLIYGNSNGFGGMHP